MIRTLGSLGIPAMLLAVTAAAAAPPPPESWSELSRPTFSDIAPSRADTTLLASPTRVDQIGRILAEVMLNGQGPFRFVIDTGASHCTISPATAEALGLSPTADSTIVVHGITGTEALPAVPIKRLQAGDLVLENIRVPVVSAPMLAGTDGILGAAGFTRERILVDFGHDQVVIARGHGMSAIADFVRIPARRIPGGLIVVRALIDGIPVSAVIDTGSERTIGNLALRDALHVKHPSASATVLTTSVYGATPEVSPGEVEIAPVIALGTARISGLPVVFGGFHIFKVWNLEREPVLILGMDALGTLQGLSIDFAQSALYLKSPDMSGGPVISHVTSR
jgi:predicted aspartyl protease